jgi:hypothetical protein
MTGRDQSVGRGAVDRHLTAVEMEALVIGIKRDCESARQPHFDRGADQVTVEVIVFDNVTVRVVVLAEARDRKSDMDLQSYGLTFGKQCS